MKKRIDAIAVQQTDLFIVSLVSQVKRTATHVRHTIIIVLDNIMLDPDERSKKFTFSAS